MADLAARKPIPVVNNILLDTPINALNGMETNTSLVTVERTLKLLTDRHSEKLVDRHVKSIKRLTQQFITGYLVRDIQSIGCIIENCANRVLKDISYEKPLCDLLKVCSNPFLKQRSSDESHFSNIVIEFITGLGNLMNVESTVVHVQVAKSLAKLYSAKGDKKTCIGLEPTSLAFNKGVIEKSGIVKAVVKCLEKTTDMDVRMELMAALQCFSESAINCDDLLFAGAARLVCNSLADTDDHGRNMFLCVDILWNMLENGSRENTQKRQLKRLDCASYFQPACLYLEIRGRTLKIAQQLDCLESISALNKAFVYLTTKGYSQADKQLRNDLLVISILVAQCRPTAPFVETGFTKELVLFATFTEVKSHHRLVRNMKFQQCREDFEFKKLLISALVVMCKDQTAVQVMSSNHVLLSLFSFVKQNDTSFSNLWTPAQFEELQLQALSALCSIAPLCIDDYMTCQGNNRLLLLLEWCIGQVDYGGHGNSYHANGGRGNKRAQMRHCLRLLRSMCSTEDEAILQDLSDQGAISEITSILWNASTSQDENDIIDIEMQCDMLLIVSCLCEGDAHRKELFSVGGVEMVIEYLKKDPEKVHSPLGYHTLFLAAVDCVWSSILGCFITEQLFLEQEGVFLLLDLLERSPPTVQGVILGCMVDICENPKALIHIYSWGGKTNISVAKLLIELWRKEEISLGVERSSYWLIKDLHKPLMGKLQSQNLKSSPLPADVPSQAIVEVSENIRAKIYAIFSKLGFNDVDGLSTMSYVTLAVIENYLEFKMFEVWQEITQELEQENVRPVSPDRDCLAEINRLFEERTDNVFLSQKELIQNQTQQDLVEEQACYAKIIANHQQKEKAFSDFYDYVNRTSDYTILKASKEKQLADIDASRLYDNSNDEEEEVCSSLQSNIATTTFCGRLVDITSDISTGSARRLVESPLVNTTPTKSESMLLVN